MLPFDVTTLLLFGGLLMSIIAGEAAYNGDTLSLRINVPPKIVETGFDATTAEKIFMAQAAWIVRGQSIIPTPTLRVSSRPTVISALATPLSLDKLVGALQDQFGYDRLVVNGAVVMSKEGSLRMVIVVEQPNRAPAQIQLTQTDADPAMLIRRGADATMARVSPYRVAQANYVQGLAGDLGALTEAKEAALRYLAGPWEPARASERAMLHNLLAMVALLEDRVPEANSQLKMAAAVPGALPEARGIVALNRAFLAVAARQPVEALDYFLEGARMAASISLPDFGARITLLNALVVWSAGDTAQAETLLRAAAVALPVEEGPHVYLAQLLATKGDQPAAASARASMAAMHPFDLDIPVFAQSIFRVDPVNGGLKRQ